jgi:ParB-like chromosome segregation protein Spo0J
VRQFGLGEFDQRYGALRLTATAEVRQAMIQSQRRYRQISPLVVWPEAGSWVLIDGFKRLEAARQVPELETLGARLIDADPRTAKAANYGLNQFSRRVHLLEEAWIVRALVRDDHLTQPEAAQLLGRDKSWISPRLALVEKLCSAAQEDLGLGLLNPSLARQLARLPTGNQQELLSVVRRDDLSALEVGQELTSALVEEWT